MCGMRCGKVCRPTYPSSMTISYAFVPMSTAPMASRVSTRAQAGAKRQPSPFPMDGSTPVRSNYP